MHHHELKLDSNKTNLTAEGHRLDNLPVPSMPCWRPCTNLCFFLLNINYRQIKSTQLNSHRPYIHNQVNGNAAIDCRGERNRKRLGSTAITQGLPETPAEALQTIPVRLKLIITV